VLKTWGPVGFVFALCPFAAALAPSDPHLPLERLDTLIAFEHAHNLYFEPGLWNWLADHPAILAVLSFLYLWGHVPATVGALVWARLERPEAFPVARDVLLTTQVLVVSTYVLVPTAPPRMRFEHVDTGGLVSLLQSPYAAMPSGHVAFAVVVAGLLATQVRALRVIAWLYPAVVTAVVIATANHLWLDAAAGTATAATAFGLVTSARRAWAPTWLRPASSSDQA
jgi:membrane-associated phospholipid phosphatase